MHRFSAIGYTASSWYAGAGEHPEKGGESSVRYATMVDLLRKAERAGEQETAFVNEQLASAFESWLAGQQLGEITEEEEDALRRAFEQGFGICVHDQA